MNITTNSDFSNFFIKPNIINKFDNTKKNLSVDDIYLPCSIICETDNNHKIRFYTESLKLKLGYSLSEDYSLSLIDIMSADNLKNLNIVINNNYNDGYQLFYTNFKLKDKNDCSHYCTANVSLKEYDSKGIITICIIFVDEKYKNTHEIRRITSLLSNDKTCFVQHRVTEDNKLKINYTLGNNSFIKSGEANTDLSTDIYQYIHTKQCYVKEYQQQKDSSKDYSAFIEIIPIKLKDHSTFNIFIQTIVYYRNGKAYCIESIMSNIDRIKELDKRQLSHSEQFDYTIKRSDITSAILEKIKNMDNYLKAVSFIMKSVCENFNVTQAEVLLPKVIHSNLYNSYTYNKQTKKENESVVKKDDINDRFGDIILHTKQFGYACNDKLYTSPGCEKDFDKLNLKSCFVHKIDINNKEFGILLLNNSNIEKLWKPSSKEVIKDIANLLSDVYYKHSSKKELSTSLSTMETILNNIDSFICVSTLESDEIIFTNQKFNDNFNLKENETKLTDIIDSSCKDYEALSNKIEFSNGDNRANCELLCKRTGQWLDITQIHINWIDSRIVKLSTIKNITQKVEYEKLIEIQALNDHLTGLPNRRQLETDFKMLLKSAIDNNQTGYIMFVDLDNFKNINDSLGHNYGDALLQKVAQFLYGIFEIANYSYRFGGDEFVILLPYNKSESLELVTNKIFQRFRSEWEILDTSYFCTMSMGIAKYPDDGTLLDDVLKKADMAMYKSKKNGKNQLTLYENQIGSDSMNNIQLQKYLREAMEHDMKGFSVNFQPIVDTKTQKIISAEVLLRWHIDELGNIPPSEFIGLCEDLGYIIPLGYYVIDEACKLCENVIQKTDKNFRMHINISIVQLLEKNFLSNALDIIKKYKVPSKQITFEITESIAIEDYRKAKKILDQIDKEGIKISLDDFGTGYSSLNHLKEMPIDNIKLDKVFIDDIANDYYMESFVNSIIILAHKLNLKVCAEGVELKEQFDLLNKMHADMIQGFYFSKPVTPNRFKEIIND